MPKEWKKHRPSVPAAESADPHGADLLAAEIGAHVPQTDLHGMREDEAVSEVERFINAQFAAGAKAARIVHGKGMGFLRKATHRVLVDYQQKGLVAAFRDSQHALGGVTVFALHSRE